MNLPVALESSLLRAANFRHGFATRALDFRAGAPARAADLDALALLLRFDPARLYQVSQVHGGVALAALGDREALSRCEADALVSTTADDAVGIRVADCVPILLADPESGVVAAAHAGWRGVVAGVLASTFRVAAERGATLRLAAIGPCIGPCCFEVSHEIAAEIASAAGDEGVVARHTDAKSWVDLRRAVRAQLRRSGLDDAHIEDVPGCTRCDAEHFFSHRRDGERAGRHLAVIVAR
jgi:polyphenol oxidase